MLITLLVLTITLRSFLLDLDSFELRKVRKGVQSNFVCENTAQVVFNIFDAE